MSIRRTGWLLVAMLALAGCSAHHAPTRYPAPPPHLPVLTLPCLPGADPTGPCAGGGPVAVASLIGTPTVLNLFASWCGPCKQELPAFQAIHAQLGPALRVIGVDTEDADAAGLALLRGRGVRYPALVDANGLLLRGLRQVGLPVTVFLGADGRVVGVHAGALTAATLAAAVHTLLGVGPAG